MSKRLRVIFAGTPAFAVAALEAIHAAGFPVPLVLTQPDRPAGRGMKLSTSSVKRFALEHGLSVLQPASLRRDGKSAREAGAALERLRGTLHDVMVVAAYGLMLPPEVLDMPRHGCVNIHASLLPRWRGAAPIQRALEAGDAETGITLMQMDAGLDTGPTLKAARVPIGADVTTAILHDQLASLGARLIVDALRELERQGALPSTPQPETGATYAKKISKAEALLDWHRPAVALARQVRAFDPFPGAAAQLDGVTYKLWAAHALDRAKADPVKPGTILAVDAQGVLIACAGGALCLTECQKPGGKRLPVRDFVAGTGLRAGQRFA